LVSLSLFQFFHVSFLDNFMKEFATDKLKTLPDFMQSRDSLSQPEAFSVSSCFLTRSFLDRLYTLQNWKPDKVSFSLRGLLTERLSLPPGFPGEVGAHDHDSHGLIVLGGDKVPK
jgi:hypothetical protein